VGREAWGGLGCRPPPPRDSIAELNQTDPSPGLQVRVGVTTGEALVVLGGAGRRPPV
jgi:class 3 adenylate cyclase